MYICFTYLNNHEKRLTKELQLHPKIKSYISNFDATTYFSLYLKQKLLLVLSL